MKRRQSRMQDQGLLYTSLNIFWIRQRGILREIFLNNDAFADHSWYFRNALVRANYNDLTRGIHAATEYLERFFENLLLGAEHELKNRYLVIGGDRTF